MRFFYHHILFPCLFPGCVCKDALIKKNLNVFYQSSDACDGEGLFKPDPYLLCFGHLFYQL